MYNKAISFLENVADLYAKFSGELDMDGVADTMISDPVGLAAAVTTTLLQIVVWALWLQRVRRSGKYGVK